jgi:hypothetical protein
MFPTLWLFLNFHFIFWGKSEIEYTRNITGRHTQENSAVLEKLAGNIFWGRGFQIILGYFKDLGFKSCPRTSCTIKIRRKYMRRCGYQIYQISVHCISFRPILTVYSLLFQDTFSERQGTISVVSEKALSLRHVYVLIAICWIMLPCRLMPSYKLFETVYCLHLQGRGTEFGCSDSLRDGTRVPHYTMI